MKFIALSSVALIIALASLLSLRGSPTEQPSELAAGGLPSRFVAFDTSRLLGSPDPLPLEAVRVFPHLKFDKPVELTYAGDGSGRLFVIEKFGLIRVFANDQATADAPAFLDLRDVVYSEPYEAGLLGLAFHPKFAENGKFYVSYVTKPLASVVSCFRVSADDPNKADRASEERILAIPQPFDDHNGGSIQFGLDGMLYLGLGDGGKRDDPSGNGQNLGALLGKILRIDVDRRDATLAYGVPPDNPFVGKAGARGEIWSYGHRNIWRLGFDRKTGDLWAGDVGQDRYEEVNLIERGGNYGWNLREGAHDLYPDTPGKDPDLIDPIAEYYHGEGQSVTGGTVYRGAELIGYDGAYFYGDWASGNIWTIRLDERKRVREKRLVARTDLSIVAFGTDAAGEMYLCALEGGIYRLRPRLGDLAAEAAAFPKRLSDTGLFTSVALNKPAPGVLPYELNVPFWSDFAVKDRYVALPRGASVTFESEGQWKFPVGTVFVKTFWMHRDRAAWRDLYRVETRLLVHAPDRWQGYTYAYADGEDEAYLVADAGARRKLAIKAEDGDDEEQAYHLPSRADCRACHTKEAGFVLGLNARQMHRDLAYRGATEPQFALWDRLGMFTERLGVEQGTPFPEWGFGNLDRSGAAHPHESAADAAVSNSAPRAPKGELAAQARAWLDVNCAMCHRPQGIGPDRRDLRYQTETAKTNFVNQPPSEKRRRIKGTALIKPGEPERSELITRMTSRGERQMPPLGTHLIDPRGTEVVRRWIKEMQE